MIDLFDIWARDFDVLTGNDTWHVHPMFGRYVDYVEASHHGIAPASNRNTSREEDQRRARNARRR